MTPPPTNDDTPAALGALRIDEGEPKNHVDEVVSSSVEETLNGLLDAKADPICRAQRYEGSPERADSRAGHYGRKPRTRMKTEPDRAADPKDRIRRCITESFIDELPCKFHPEPRTHQRQARILLYYRLKTMLTGTLRK